MNQKRTAEAFPDRNTPGDPRLLRSIHARTPKSSGEETHLPGGVVVGDSGRRARSASVPCALGRVLSAAGLDGASEGDVYLPAGFVNAAGDSYAVGGPEDTILTPTIGDTFYVELDVEVEVDDGVLTGGWSSSAAALAQDSSMPSDDTLDDTSTTGTVYAPLGEWIDDGNGNPRVQGLSCGNVTFILCVQSNNTATANYYRG